LGKDTGVAAAGDCLFDKGGGTREIHFGDKGGRGGAWTNRKDRLIGESRVRTLGKKQMREKDVVSTIQKKKKKKKCKRKVS